MLLLLLRSSVVTTPALDPSWLLLLCGSRVSHGSGPLFFTVTVEIVSAAFGHVSVESVLSPFDHVSVESIN